MDASLAVIALFSLQSEFPNRPIDGLVFFPSLEVRLLNHLAGCPNSYYETKDIERRTAYLKIVGGSRDKYIYYDRIGGMRADARKNASAYNTQERAHRYAQQNNLDFGPWTDMFAMVTQMKEDGIKW